MLLHEMIQQAYNTKWDYTNNFVIQINQSPNSVQFHRTFFEIGELINLHIQNVELPDLTGQAIEHYSIDRWNVALGPDMPYRFTITFNDSDDMRLWKSFMRQYELTKLNYFDDSKLEVSVFNASDYHEDEYGQHIVTFREAIIESVGRFPLSNEEEAKIVKFTVGFKQTRYSVEDTF